MGYAKDGTLIPNDAIDYAYSKPNIRKPCDYYDYCYLMKDGSLTFGDEQGNYCGGDTLRLSMYENIDKYKNEVKHMLLHIKKYESTKYFYKQIELMLERNNLSISDWISNIGDNEK